MKLTDQHGPPPTVSIAALEELKGIPVMQQLPLFPERTEGGSWRVIGVPRGAVLRLEGVDAEGTWRTREWRFPDAAEVTVSWP